MSITAQSNEKYNQELNDFFVEQNCSFKLYPSNEDKTYKSLKDFYDFVNSQVIFWNGLNGKAASIRSHFTNILNYLDQAKNNQNANIQQSKINIQGAISNININRFPCIFSISLEAEFLKELYTVSYEQGDAACEYLFNVNSNSNNQMNISLTNKNVFNGLIYAYFFRHPTIQDNVFKNIDKSFDDLRHDYISSLNLTDQEYYKKMNEVKQSNNIFKEELTDWKTSLNSFIDEKKKELIDLTSLYEEKLKLEAPAKYWEETSIEYNQRGRNWICVTLATAVVFIGFLTILLFELPVGNLKLNATSFKLTLILGIIISMGVFLINFFIRLATSAFHLSRDANERHKLTYVYLALLKDKSIEDTDRSIILQSLFSRADTGLLKGDSSPTLPDGLIGQVFKGIVK